MCIAKVTLLYGTIKNILSDRHQEIPISNRVLTHHHHHHHHQLLATPSALTRDFMPIRKSQILSYCDTFSNFWVK